MAQEVLGLPLKHTAARHAETPPNTFRGKKFPHHRIRTVNPGMSETLKQKSNIMEHPLPFTGGLGSVSTKTLCSSNLGVWSISAVLPFWHMRSVIWGNQYHRK